MSEVRGQSLDPADRRKSAARRRASISNGSRLSVPRSASNPPPPTDPQFYLAQSTWLDLLVHAVTSTTLSCLQQRRARREVPTSPPPVRRQCAELNWTSIWTEVNLKIFIFTRMNISGSKTNENNKLSNSTIDINSRHIQHDEVGNTWNYTEQNNLWLECVILYNYLNIEIAWHTALSVAQYIK